MEPNRSNASALGGLVVVLAVPVGMIWGYFASGPIGIAVGAGVAIMLLTVFQMLFGRRV